MTKPLDPIEATTATRAGKSGGQTPPERTLQADAASDPHGGACANCGTALAGEYCHHCGQYAHNPLTSFRHAVEDIFESFWHLDGRIFRTLRELFIPGRVARSYLAGHRVRYIPPLRLFVILSLLTFFVGKLVLHFEPNINVGGEPVSYAADASIADVEARRDRLLAGLGKAEAEAAGTPGADAALVAARARIQGQAAARIAQLREKSGASTAAATATPAQQARDTAPAVQTDEPPDCDALVAESRQAPWVPQFAARWIKERVRKGCDNLRHADTEGGRLFEQFLGAVPTTLFLLMPVFALLLKLCFLGTGRSYLEHMVVALYSHCFLLLMLMALFLLTAATNGGAPAWLTGPALAAVWIYVPVYLWLMQRRVYGGGRAINALRFLVVGLVYVVMVTFATAFAALHGISS